MATLAELEAALIAADKAGDVEAARKLASVVAWARQDKALQVPGAQVIIPEPEQKPSVGEIAKGTAQAAATLATGATTGTLGMIGGTLKGLAEQILSGKFGTQEAMQAVAESAGRGQQALTYQPTSPVAAQILEPVGQALAPLTAVAPMLGLPAQAASAARQAAPAAAMTSQAATGAARRVAAPIQRARAELAAVMPEEQGGRPGALGSVGSAGTEMVEQRLATAEGLPVPVRLTRGAATRTAEQLEFEKEQLKSPSLGAPLRARAEENNLQVLQNFDAFFDATGATVPNPARSGDPVVKALAQGYQNAKNATNVAYARARKSPEAQAPVDVAAPVVICSGDNQITGSLLDYINGQTRGISANQMVDEARQIALRVGIAQIDEAGNLVPGQATVGMMEQFRQELLPNVADPRSVRQATILKKLVDAQTEPVAGPLFQEARSLRAEQSRKFENRAVVARLLDSVRGMDDPRVPADQVFQRSVLNASPEEITFLRRVLTTLGDNGKQAFKELQGATVRHIEAEATKAGGMDSSGRPLVSTAKLHQVMRDLDSNGRLDVIFGKRTAQQMRDLDEVLRYVLTVPPGTLLNNAGTGGRIMAAIVESGVTGYASGLPLPVISGLRLLRQQIDNRRIRAKIDAALNPRAQEPKQ